MFKTLTTVAFATILAIPLYAANLPMTMATGTLSPTCEFSNTVTGTITYDEATERFVASGGTPSTVDIFYRNMSSITVVSDGTLGSNTNAFDSVDYTAGNSTLGATPVLNDTGSGPLHGVVTLTNAETEETLSILPTADVKSTIRVTQNTAYATNFIVTCVQ